MTCYGVLEARGITKIYPGGIKALDNVDFKLCRGEVHAILGENGAGKSTLAKILTGHLLPTSGEILLEGTRVVFKGPWDAIRKGIVYIPQYPRLIDALTVAENAALYLNLDPQDAYKRLKEYMDILSLSVDPSESVYNLTFGQRQRLSIALGLAKGAKILFLDEPTTVLTTIEVENFIKIVKQLASEGYSIGYVTHRLNEVYLVADRATILRRGKVVAYLEEPSRYRPEDLAKLMVGELIGLYRRDEGVKVRKTDYKEPILIVKDLVVENDYGLIAVDNVSFKLYPGEALGIAGVEGNGQQELVEALIGLRRPRKGLVLVGNTIIKSPKDFRRVGGAYIPDDRFLALAPDLTITDNILADKAIRARLLGKKLLYRTRKIVQVIIDKYGIVGKPNDKLFSLSGGNQQRVLIAREVERRPRLLIAYRPSISLDIASTRMLLNMLQELKLNGTAVIYVADDIEELLAIADKIAVMVKGRFKAILDASKTTKNEIAKYMVQG